MVDLVLLGGIDNIRELIGASKRIDFYAQLHAAHDAHHAANESDWPFNDNRFLYPHPFD
jgi:hypothetical protein